MRGHIAAATSTGGMTGKQWGRVGDSPVLGAGTWATDATCAISGTGHGEFYLRLALAHDIAARMAYARKAPCRRRSPSSTAHCWQTAVKAAA